MRLFVHEDETLLERGMVRQLQSIAERLTPWQRNFLDSMVKWSGNFTWNQAKTIVLMHAKHFPKQYKELLDIDQPVK